MRIVAEHRASIILYNVLVAGNFKGKFLLPANVCPVVPATFMKAGIDFEFVDIDSSTWCIGEAAMINQLSADQSVAGIVFVGTYGYGGSAESIFSKVKEIRPELFIIDDRCLSRPELEFSTWNSLADMKLCSTGYSKYVELGYGGYGVLKPDVDYQPQNLPFDSQAHDDLQEQFRNALNTGHFEYRNTDWLGDTHENISVPKYFKAIADRMREVNQHKQKINDIYLNEIPGAFQLDPSLNDWRFNICVSNKEEILEAIFAAGLFASSHYQSLAGIFGPGSGANAKSLHNRVVNLFNDFRFSEDDALKVAQVVNQVGR